MRPVPHVNMGKQSNCTGRSPHRPHSSLLFVLLLFLHSTALTQFTPRVRHPWNRHHNNNKPGFYMSEPELMESQFAMLKTNHWHSPNHNYMFDDSNNYLHEFFGSDNGHQQFPQQSHMMMSGRQRHQHHQHHNFPMGGNAPYQDHTRFQPAFGASFQGANFQRPSFHHQREPDHSGMEGYSEDKPIKAAVISHHEHQVYRVPSEFQYREPTVVQLEGKIYPLELHWSSYSSPMITKHGHYPSENHHEDTYSQGESHTHIHTISKPIYHEVRQVISPQKNWFRVIRPLREKVQAYFGVDQRGKENSMQHYHRFHGYDRPTERSLHEHQRDHR